jgi:hypothetical protein
MFECYATLSDPVADWTCSSEVIDMWTDDEGNTWYKCVFQSYGGGSSTYYALDRVSNGGKTWERAFSNIEYPKLIDPDDVMAMYRIYYRQ